MVFPKNVSFLLNHQFCLHFSWTPCKTFFMELACSGPELDHIFRVIVTCCVLVVLVLQMS